MPAATQLSFFGAILIIAGTAVVTSRLKENLRLGRPGLKMENFPILIEDGTIARTNRVYFPTVVPGYHAEAGPLDKLEDVYLPKDTSFGRCKYTSSSGDLVATASVVLMGADRTSLHKPEYCLPGQGWDIRQQKTFLAPLNSPERRELEIRRFDLGFSRVREDGRRETKAGVYLFWFIADGEQTASTGTRTYLMMKDLLLKNVLQRWAYVSFFAECRPGGEEETSRKLTDLIASVAPLMSIQGTSSR
jgi:hypothetical protein